MLRVVLALAVVTGALRAGADPGPARAPRGADAEAPSGGGRLGGALAPRLRLALAAGNALEVEPLRGGDPAPPACVADFCQPRVDVPGLDGFRRRASRTELLVALLDRAKLEPAASIAWFFVATGLRVDWTPAALDESFGATAGGWGNLFVRVRMRLDPWNRPAVPMRPRERMRRERERAAAQAHADEAARLRRGVAAAASRPPPADEGAPGLAHVAAGPPGT